MRLRSRTAAAATVATVGALAICSSRRPRRASARAGWWMQEVGYAGRSSGRSSTGSRSWPASALVAFAVLRANLRLAQAPAPSRRQPSPGTSP